MKRFSQAALIILIAGAAFFAADVHEAEAQTPQYRVLQAPAPTMHPGGHGYYPAHAQPVAPQRYAYGWFGAQPRRHWSRHFGYYRNYTQWTAR